MSLLKDYPGAKNGSGIIPWLINNIPYHERYIELFSGSAALYRAKKAAEYANQLNDINPAIVEALIKDFGQRENTKISNYHYRSYFDADYYDNKDFIYLDPPYHEDDRRSGAEIYTHEMMGNDDHVQLLTAILQCKASIMISSGQNKLYQLHLKDWRRKEFATMGHRGPRVEVIYMNYPEPKLLHQYDYLGDNYVQRQALARKRKRQAALLQRLPPFQKHVLIEEMIKNDPAAVQHFMAVFEANNNIER